MWRCCRCMLGGAAIVFAACADPVAPRQALLPNGPARFAAPAETWVYDTLASGATPGFAEFLEADGYNDAGQIAGFGFDWSFRWTGGAIERTPPNNSGYWWARDINGAGDVVGTHWNSDPTAEGFFWHITGVGAGTIRILPQPGGMSNPQTYAEDMNDARYVVGYQHTDVNTDYRAVLWMPAPQPGDPYHWTITTLPRVGDQDIGVRINNSTTVLGLSVAGARSRAWVKNFFGNATLLPLGPYGYVESWPGDINDSGVVVGVAKYAAHGQTHYRVVTWSSPSAWPIDIIGPDVQTPYDELYSSERLRISNKGRVAGVAYLHSADDLAPFTVRNGVFTPLPMPPGYKTGMYDLMIGGINTCGEIVGRYIDTNPNSGVNHLIRWRRVQSIATVCD